MQRNRIRTKRKHEQRCEEIMQYFTEYRDKILDLYIRRHLNDAGTSMRGRRSAISSAIWLLYSNAPCHVGIQPTLSRSYSAFTQRLLHGRRHLARNGKGRRIPAHKFNRRRPLADLPDRDRSALKPRQTFLPAHLCLQRKGESAIQRAGGGGGLLSARSIVARRWNAVAVCVRFSSGMQGSERRKRKPHPRKKSGRPQGVPVTSRAAADSAGFIGQFEVRQIRNWIFCI